MFKRLFEKPELNHFRQKHVSLEFSARQVNEKLNSDLGGGWVTKHL